MNKYLKVGLITLVFCGLAVGKVHAVAADTLELEGTVSAIHRVSVSNANQVVLGALGTNSYDGQKMGEVVINNNNPTGFAVRFYSSNYANGFADLGNAGQAVLLLSSSSTNFPAGSTINAATVGAVTGNVTYSKPGLFIPYYLTVSEKSGATGQGMVDANMMHNATAIGNTAASAPEIAIKNTTTDAASDSNEIRCTSPYQATIGFTWDVGITTTAKSTLFAGTFKDTIKVLILDLDTNGADRDTLYNESGSVTTFGASSDLYPSGL